MAANQASNSLLKVNQFAKDLNMKTKDVTAILEEKGIAVKTQKPMEPGEFDVLFEALTKANQINNIEDYLDGITYIPSKKKAVSAAKAATADEPTEDTKKKEAEAKPAEQTTASVEPKKDAPKPQTEEAPKAPKQTETPAVKTPEVATKSEQTEKKAPTETVTRKTEPAPAA